MRDFLQGPSAQVKCEVHRIRWGQASDQAISLAPAKGERLVA